MSNKSRQLMACQLKYKTFGHLGTKKKNVSFQLVAKRETPDCTGRFWIVYVQVILF